MKNSHRPADPFELQISDVWSRIKRAETPMAVFTVHDKVSCIKPDTIKFYKMLEQPDAVFIGVYNPMCRRVDLSADISLIVDEIPEHDECIKKTRKCSSTK